ncbi:F0F1 ATP synthase subunit epsilon [Roseicitreum antarcticum]|uniref:ATP synthase epsilon chain n=1 Tax=Roseicitreum antarcticum TaxID=564137 RepID=A0A1H2UNN7_9RHOB|nr:F0F1 ATP synthase subunit epsilon [Roseicitreum antarcticum]SDW57727.1 ATP synthase F1 subcomplex epsilon subunit [Roseicitreum antarcticum]
MADTMQFDLVSPERKVVSAQVTEVQIPGADGDFTAMAGHSPFITTLRPGVLTTVGPDGSHDYAVTGGFAEIGTKGVTVLAEQGMASGDLTQEAFDDMVTKARAAHSEAPADAVDAAAKLVADMVAMGDRIGLGATR